MFVVLFAACTPAEQDAVNEALDEEGDKTTIKTEDSTVTIDEGEREVTVESDEGTVKIEEKEDGSVTMETENASITISEDGSTTEVVLESDGEDRSTGLPIEDWCVPGTSYDHEDEEGNSVSAEIIGPSEFKGKEYCHAKGTDEIQGMTITYEYYFNDGATDMWALTEVMGQTNEIHIVSE